MKKLLILTLASVSFIAQTTSLFAAEVKFGGEFRVRGFYTNNLSDFHNSGKNLTTAPCVATNCDDQEAFADERFRLRGNVTSGITSGVFAVDLTNSFAGTDPATVQNPASLPGAGFSQTGDTRFGTVGFGRSYNVVGIREAYLKFKFPTFGVTTGRAPFKLGHGLILDDTADAIAVNFGAMGLNLTVADLRLFDSNASGLPGHTGGDADLYLFNATFNHMDNHLIGLFIAYLNDRGPGLATTFLTPSATGVPLTATDDKIWAAGVSAEGKLAMIKLGLEADVLNGKAKAGIPGGGDAKISGYNFLVNAGVIAGPADVGVLLLYASGQKASGTKTNVNGFSGNFVLGNILLNDETTADRDGVTPSDIMAVKLSAGVKDMLMKDSAADVDVIYAQLAQKPASVCCGSKKDLGIEVDLNGHQKIDDNLMLNVGLGLLSPGKGWKALKEDADAKNLAYKAGIGLTYSF